MGREFYIASCMFTAQFPHLSQRIQRYVAQRRGISVVRCCVPQYKLREFEEKMPEECRAGWRALPDSGDFQAGDRVYSLCHNCSNLIEESRPGVQVSSLWELILSDGQFPYPDYSPRTVTVQDCWRAKERRAEQGAVRTLLGKMGLDVVELEENFQRTEFCGPSLYRPQPPRNPQLAPLHYEKNAKGKFLPHTEEEQRALMEEYCRRFSTREVVCYCHYCLEGLLMGGKEGRHLAELLFPG